MLREAVESQVAKILASGCFEGALRLSDFFKYLVTETLNGRRLKDADVTREFFGKKPQTFEHEESIARRTLHRLRTALQNYYATEGDDDSIQIVFEKPAFVPKFLPRQTTPFHKELARGLFQIDLEAPANIERAMAHFNEAIRLAPQYLKGDDFELVADAHAGKAMALCTKTLHDIRASPAELFPEADIELQKALEWNPDSWRAHCARGGMYAFRRIWKQADADFNTARKIHKKGMLDHGAYGPYLLGRGRYMEARSLARRDEEKHTDVTFLKRAALFLYALRDFAEAERILNELFALNEGLWHAHTLEAMVCLATDRPEKALSHMREISSQKYPDLWPGLHVLCLERNGCSEEARERFDRLTQEAASQYIEPMQLALGYMAFDEPKLAIERLEEGAEVGDIHMLWLHLWPFLDPLREYPEFKKLLLKLTLPSPPGSRAH